MALDRRRLKRQLRMFAIARSDLLAAQRAGLLLVDLLARVGDDNQAAATTFPEFRPIMHALVVDYARPFVGARGGSRLQGSWARFPTEDMQKAHDRVLLMRNAIVAHSDEQERDVTVYPRGTFGVTVVLGHDEPRHGLTVSTSWVLVPTPTIRAIVACSRDLEPRVRSELDRLVEVLYDGRADLPTQPFRVTDCDGV